MQGGVFQGKKVIVTGATRGIGRAVARAFRAEGAWVAGTGTREAAEATEGLDAYFQCDFADLVQIEACAGFVSRTQPDILVNNAGINKIAAFAEIDPQDFLRIQQVNVFAPFRLCQAAVPAMKSKSWGRVINISSIWGIIAKEYRASYAASKFALDGMTLALASEVAKDGIIANCIAPGFTDTELTRRVLGDAQIKELVASVPARRMADVDEIARLVLWLASPDNSYITGQNIAIDGGFTRV